MTPRRRHRSVRATYAAVGTLLLGSLVAATASPAGAAEPEPWSRVDATGDAPAAADLQAVRTSWEGNRILARAEVRDLGPTGRFRVSLVVDGETIHLYVRKTKSTIVKRVQNYNFEGKHQNLKCQGIKVTWSGKHDFISVSAPLASCVDSGPWGTDGMWLKGPSGDVDKVGTIWWTGD